MMNGRMQITSDSFTDHDLSLVNENTSFEEKWGEVCPVCKLRKGTFASFGTNLPKVSSVCKCEDNADN